MWGHKFTAVGLRCGKCTWTTKQIYFDGHLIFNANKGG